MIKKILIAGAMTASAAFLVPQASAQTFSPTGPFTLANTGGQIKVQKGITLSCNLAGSGSVDASGNASVTSLTLSGGTLGLCGSITFTGTPYVVSGVSPSTVTINGMVVTAVTGNCAGNLTGSYSGGVITFTNATLPSTSGGNACTIDGKVKISPALTF